MLSLARFTLFFYYLKPDRDYKDYQGMARIYLDEYEGQKEARLIFFMKNWNLKSNQGIRNVG